MKRADRIVNILTQELAPSQLELTDESAKHAGHAGAAPGGETHYHLVIAAECLQGKSRVAQHQQIMGLLASEFTSGLHALSIEIR